MTRVLVEIDEIVFHGLSDGDAQTAGAAFSAELQRLIETHGLARPSPPRMAAPTATPLELGRTAAAHVHRRLAQ